MKIVGQSRELSKFSNLIKSTNRETWLRLMIIVVTVLTAAGIGLRPSSRLSKIPGLIVLGMMGLIMLIRYFPGDIIVLIPVSFLVDFQIKTGTNVNLNASFVLAILFIGVWMLRMVIINKQVRLAPSPLNLPALVFIFACTLAWLTSFLPWVPLASEKPSLPAQAGAYLLYVLSIAMILLFSSNLQNIKQLRLFTWTFVIFSTIYMLAQIIPRNFTSINTWLVGNFSGNSIYWIWLTAISLGQALFNQRLRKSIRLVLIIIALLCFAFNLWTRPQWIGGWLPPLIVILLLFWLRDWRIGLAVTVLGTLIFIPYYTTIYLRVNTDTQQWSTFTRVATWPIVVSLFEINPITGLGPAAYRFYTQLFSYVGYYIPFNTHNNYFDIVLQTGLLGLAAFAWLAAAIFRLGWKLRQRAADGFSRGYANAVLAGMVATLASGVMVDWFLPFVYNIGIPGFQASMYAWLFAGGLAGLERILNQPSGRES